MSDLSKHPSLALPKDLQEHVRALDREIEVLTKKRQNLLDDIQRVRAACKHRAFEGTQNHYVTYCEKCGHAMDSWL